jgi:hypothetical protein
MCNSESAKQGNNQEAHLPDQSGHQTCITCTNIFCMDYNTNSSLYMRISAADAKVMDVSKKVVFYQLLLKNNQTTWKLKRPISKVFLSVEIHVNF